jgi:hypothetical protein
MYILPIFTATKKHLASEELQRASLKDIYFGGCSLSAHVGANWDKGPETGPYRGLKTADGTCHFNAIHTATPTAFVVAFGGK